MILAPQRRLLWLLGVAIWAIFEFLGRAGDKNNREVCPTTAMNHACMATAERLNHAWFLIERVLDGYSCYVVDASVQRPTG